MFVEISLASIDIKCSCRRRHHDDTAHCVFVLLVIVCRQYLTRVVVCCILNSPLSDEKFSTYRKNCCIWCFSLIMACLHPVMMSPNLLTSNCILSFRGLMIPSFVCGYSCKRSFRAARSSQTSTTRWTTRRTAMTTSTRHWTTCRCPSRARPSPVPATSRTSPSCKITSDSSSEHLLPINHVLTSSVIYMYLLHEY